MADISYVNLPDGVTYNITDLYALHHITAPEYDSTSTYNRGDFVTYQGDVYICDRTITTPEPWNQYDWELAHAHDDSYLHSLNPNGAGSFGMNRKPNTTVGYCSFAEGLDTEASGSMSHAEGSYTTASGGASHAEGSSTTASGDYAHAEGIGTTASAPYSHTEGNGTSANHRSQHVFGEYNITDPSSATSSYRGNYVEIVGNGDKVTPSNARTLDWNGNEVLAGGLKINSTQDVAAQVSLTQAEYDALVSAGTVDLVNTIYFITDADAVAGSAAEISYSNATSGLSATNVQGAIDAIDSTVDNIGILKNGTMSGSVACANDTVTEVGSVTLDIGIYLLVGGVNWAANATGFRQAAFADGLNPARPTAVTTAACSGSKQTFVQVIQLIQVSVNNTTIKLYGWQNSGSSLTAYPFITTARLR